MDLTENIREGLRSIRSNMLRNALTVIIITLGITLLVGIQAAVDAIQASINESFSSLGANKFDIYRKGERGRFRGGGRDEKVYPVITYREALAFQENYDVDASVSLWAAVSDAAEVKYESKTSNPNSSVLGSDDRYPVIQGLNVESGRNFSQIEISNGADVAILGKSLSDFLFDKKDPIGESITALGRKFRVIGVLEEQGQVGSGGVDQMVLIPLNNARSLATRELSIRVSATINDPSAMEYAMGEATGLFRKVRQDDPGEEDSFEIRRSESLAARLEDMTSYLTIGGVVLGALTLLGASIALMNIMMVTVTERTREIGVRKALGATPFKIRLQFLIEAIVICQIGGLAGIFFGILLGNWVSALLEANTFIIPWAWIIGGFIAGMIVGLISGLLPAYKASRLDPIESLRFE